MAQTLLPSRVVTFGLALLAREVGRSQCLTAVTAFDGDTDNGFGHATDIGGGLIAV
jgi:hypothetical protein